MANGGVILPIDDYVEQYMDKADLEDFHPLYQFLPTYKGKRWGFFDDGDVFALYYRTGGVSMGNGLRQSDIAGRFSGGGKPEGGLT